MPSKGQRAQRGPQIGLFDEKPLLHCFLHPKGPDVAQRISQYLSTTFEHRAIHLLADKFQILYDWYDNVDRCCPSFTLKKSTPDFLKLVVFLDSKKANQAIAVSASTTEL